MNEIYKPISPDEARTSIRVALEFDPSQVQKGSKRFTVDQRNSPAANTRKLAVVDCG